MVQKAVYFTIIYLFLTPTLIYNGHIPNAAKFIIEMMAVGFIPVILICLAVNKKFYAPLRYLVLLLITFFIVGISFFYNQSSASSLILGLRHHFTYIPFFLLPLVYNFTENQIKKILWLICALLLLQAPISFFQRFIFFTHMGSGDVVRGTVGGSGVLSVLLVSAISILYSLFLAKQIALPRFIMASAIFLFPTLINETKATFIMLPIALTISTLLFGEKNILLKLKKIGTFVIVTFITLSIFSYAYSIFYGNSKSSILNHFQKEIQGKGYLYYGDRALDRAEQGYYTGRMDVIMFAARNISQDIGHFFFGIGIGNTIPTKISFLKTENTDIQKFKPDMTTISNYLWELGFSGLLIHLAFLAVMFKDAFSMRGQHTFISALSLSLCSIMVVYFITLFYFNVLYMKVYSITFFLLSGIIVSKNYQFMQTGHSYPKNSERIQLSNPNFVIEAINQNAK